MTDYKQELKSVIQEFESLKKSFDLEKKKMQLHRLEADSTDPQFWSDQQKAKSVMQEIADIKNEIKTVSELDDEIKTLSELSQEIDLESFAKELKQIEKKLKKLTTSSYLSGQYDKKNTIFSIHSGQGGVEAMDWVSMLYRMYLRFCEKQDWKSELLDINSGDEAGLKNVTLKIYGNYAYGYLKGEAGTHRLVRQSPFNADKKRETSFALVEVLPELEEVDIPDIKIKDEDLDWQFFRSSGQGGQNVQKVSTAVRLIHKPTGITVTAQSERYQEQNRKNALDHMRAKLWALEQKKHEEKIGEIKGDYRPASWGTQIRSYVLHPYKMVKDLRTEVETSDTEGVLDGELDQFIEAELKLPN
ncbi:peptide chain release factor 2 [Candidatus Woesebacteria bacterium RBG_16_34_12]|uniref:Peptide chain release factor 2 n=1 Tax=Candidatus Woesebacteria bacterium RBG_16_34_12 TaxID=1802480 RepID=A0A1F7XA15_9BACT|nr:MAG: peptide chain release factor 2 [Candidatus Woesebacteria bacterium RBG_16_34_12]